LAKTLVVKGTKINFVFFCFQVDKELVPAVVRGPAKHAGDEADSD
jgi:hypothetical protein